MYNPETKTCQNCKTLFTIEPEDFEFYHKIKVPPPTWCPECRMIRRMMWRNERALYKRSCDNCRKEIVSIYDTEVQFPVYCQDCWWGDGWEALKYGRYYDFQKQFFLQFQELYTQVPRLALYHRKSEQTYFSQITTESKNIYLSYSIVESEDIMYSKNIDQSRKLVDCLNTTHSEQSYENVFGEKNYNAKFVEFSRNCLDSWFLFDCVNCRNCVLSTNLRNKEFIIRNQQLSKEIYFEELKKLNFGSNKILRKLKQEFEELKLQAIHKYANVNKSSNATGDNILNTKNVRHCFDGYDLENAAYSLRYFRSKDGMDVLNTFAGELLYEYANGGRQNNLLKFSMNGFSNLNSVEYTDHCHSSSNLFGCIGLRNKEYCILNKQYTKEEYGVLVPKIIDHMNNQPYIDKNSKEYRYGEFFPSELSLFAYNETIAQEHFPLTQEQSRKFNYFWKNTKERNYKITLSQDKLPDHINDVSDNITHEVIECDHGGKCNEQCTFAFRIISQELEFYRQHKIPLPRLCPNCRHYERIAKRNPLKLWHRVCQCTGATSENKIYTNQSPHFHKDQPCPHTFETSYAPERPEIVYCEQCYQQEVV